MRETRKNILHRKTQRNRSRKTTSAGWIELEKNWKTLIQDENTRTDSIRHSHTLRRSNNRETQREREKIFHLQRKRRGKKGKEEDWRGNEKTISVKETMKRKIEEDQWRKEKGKENREKGLQNKKDKWWWSEMDSMSKICWFSLLRYWSIIW